MKNHKKYLLKEYDDISTIQANFIPDRQIINKSHRKGFNIHYLSKERFYINRKLYFQRYIGINYVVSFYGKYDDETLNVALNCLKKTIS